jgi:hypothetical protein
MSTDRPPKSGSFTVCSANSLHWLKIGDTLGDILWTVNHGEAAKFNHESFHKMMRENPWLDGAELWFTSA